MRVGSDLTFGCVVIERHAKKGMEPSGALATWRGPWWPLRGRAAEDAEAQKLTDTLNLDFFQFEAERPHVCGDLGLIASYISVCDRLEIECHALLCRLSNTGCMASPWLGTLLARVKHLGFDVNYAAGGFSFVNVDYADVDLRHFLDRRLNQHKLLSTSSDVNRFLDLYAAARGRNDNMEDLDGALPLELWIDENMRELRRIAGTELEQ